ncbi:dihydroneopterin aldolase [Marinivivus vitaminiproducens]|uniref:dihydroneopterin aldolase n=1 Tax=Marinivivus vitaminiproducens TaxID=3035935 RepID=UPI0027A3E389|nr:dihydroneopterin aldolase [Geminicoccaceae bacterium SCSIO 64248]
MPDRIILKNVAVFAHHGVFGHERREGQRFFIDLVCALDVRSYSRSDDHAKAVGYDALFALVVETATKERYNLLEALAERIAERVLAGHPAVREVEVEVRKPNAPLPGVLDYAAVRITRGRDG